MMEHDPGLGIDELGEQPAEARGPAIKHGWLRAILFLIASIVGSGITGGIGFLGIMLAQGVEFSEMSSDMGELTESLGSGTMALMQLFGLVGILLVTWVFRRFIDRKSVMSLGFQWRGFEKDFWTGSFWGIGMIAAGFVVLLLLGNVTIAGYKFDIGSLLGFFALFVVVALSEEILVRGYILTNLMDSMNRYVALVVSSVLFFLMHGVNPNMGVLPGVNLFFAGIVLGAYFIFKRNLWFSIGMHLTWNFFQGPIFGFAVSGMSAQSLVIQETHGSDLLTGGRFGFEGSLLETFFSVVIIAFIIWKFGPRQGKTGESSTLDYS